MKNRNFSEKQKFCSKIEILVKKRKLEKTKIFFKNRNFGPKIRILVKNLNFIEKQKIFDKSLNFKNKFQKQKF